MSKKEKYDFKPNFQPPKMASFFGKIFFFCLNTKLSGIKNCSKKKFCKLDNFVIFENIDENVPSSSLWFRIW